MVVSATPKCWASSFQLVNPWLSVSSFWIRNVLWHRRNPSTFVAMKQKKWYNGLRRPSRELQATNRRYITSKKFPTFHTLENFNVPNKFFGVRNFWCPKLLAAQKNQSNTFQLFQNVMSCWQNALHWRRMLWEC